MPKQKLTIIPVTLHSEKNHVKPPISSVSPSSSRICTIKTDQAEVTFHQGIDERTIQIVMRELKNL